MPFFNDLLRYFFSAVGALYLLAAAIYALGGPCIIPHSIVCSF